MDHEQEEELLMRAVLEQSMLENQSSKSGKPPASQLALQQDLSDIVIESKQSVEKCAVCTDIFNTGQDAKKLPCKHIFHDECILAWLKMVRF